MIKKLTTRLWLSLLLLANPFSMLFKLSSFTFSFAAVLNLRCVSSTKLWTKKKGNLVAIFCRFRYMRFHTRQIYKQIIYINQNHVKHNRFCRPDSKYLQFKGFQPLKRTWLRRYFSSISDLFLGKTSVALRNVPMKARIAQSKQYLRD